MNRKVLIAGCGYIGSQLAHREVNAGSIVTAMVRTDLSANEQTAEGINAQTHCLDSEDMLHKVFMGNYDILYYLVPPQPEGKSDERSRRFLRLFNSVQFAQLVLISTTGVYGDCAGAWIDEMQPPSPIADRAKRRCSSEEQWRQFANDRRIPLTILRVAGIYGPGKLPIERLKRGTPVLAVDESPWSNRIYSKDLLTICFAAGRKGFDGVLNVVDDQPGTMTEYFQKVADSLGIKRPPEISMSEAMESLGSGILSYLSESRRIRNTKVKKELDIELQYPALEDGLRDINQASSAEKI